MTAAIQVFKWPMITGTVGGPLIYNRRLPNNKSPWLEEAGKVAALCGSCSVPLAAYMFRCRMAAPVGLAAACFWGGFKVKMEMLKSAKSAATSGNSLCTASCGTARRSGAAGVIWTRR